MFRLGYNTNGLAHHRLDEALLLLDELGYEGVAITPDVGQLDPYRLAPAELAEVRRLAEDLGLSLAIETGARFLLDPRRKHRPTLLETDAAERGRRVDFLCRCVDLGAELGAEVVSLWSGAAPEGPAGAGDRAGDPVAEPYWERLCQGLEQVLAHARERGLALAFEPEPGMFIERPQGYRELVRRLGASGPELGLTIDVGHLLCTGDLPVGRVLAEQADVLAHVHLDDIRAGVHEHRLFGEGDLDLCETLESLITSAFRGMAAVELSRDSHRGAEAARLSMERLRAALGAES